MHFARQRSVLWRAGLAVACVTFGAGALGITLGPAAAQANAADPRTSCAAAAHLVFTSEQAKPIAGSMRTSTNGRFQLLPFTDAAAAAPPPSGLSDAPAAAPRASVGPATVSVAYTGFTADARAAFQFAVDEWKSTITSPVPITIAASFGPLADNVLGGARPSDYVRTQNSPWLPLALADAIFGQRVEPDLPDITAIFTTRFPWYFGTDGATPPDEVDFASVVLHELGHGLGFAGLLDYDNGLGGYNTPDGVPAAFDTLLTTSVATPLINLPSPSTALGAALTGDDLFFSGDATIAAAGGNGLKLFAPSTWLPGSSVYHADPSVTAAALMAPALAAGVAIHAPGPIVGAVMRDLGWTAATLAIPSVVRNVKASGGANSAKLTWTAPASTGGSPITGFHVSLVAPDGMSVRADSKTPAVTVKGLHNGVAYQARVTATNAVGTGAETLPVMVTPHAVATTTTKPHSTTTTTSPGKQCHPDSTTTTTTVTKVGGVSETSPSTVAAPTAAPTDPPVAANNLSATPTGTPLPHTGAGSFAPIVLLACALGVAALAGRRFLFR